MVELFTVGLFHPSPKLVIAPVPHVTARKLPTQVNVERGPSPRTPRPDSHRFKHDGSSLANRPTMSLSASPRLNHERGIGSNYWITPWDWPKGLLSRASIEHGKPLSRHRRSTGLHLMGGEPHTLSRLVNRSFRAVQRQTEKPMSRFTNIDVCNESSPDPCRSHITRVGKRSHTLHPRFLRAETDGFRKDVGDGSRSHERGDCE